jgi:hypothetical protein
MKSSRIFGNTCYACGAMDRVPDGGVGWRQDIKPFINSLGVGFLDPCDKPISMAEETPESRQERERQKEAGEYDRMSQDMKEIRGIDLRMVDISHFLVVNINLEHYACGTIEEITTANLQRKPILIHVTQGKRHCPDWLIGMLGPRGHDMIFDTWEEMKDYLNVIAYGTDEEADLLNRHRRWVFFDFHRIFNKDVSGFI